MDINRNQWFMAGLVMLLLGIQFRVAESFVLTQEFTQLLAQGAGDGTAVAGTTSPLLRPFQAAPALKKTVKPPDWLGWVLLSVGLVLCLQALAMKKPDQ